MRPTLWRRSARRAWPASIACAGVELLDTLSHVDTTTPLPRGTAAHRGGHEEHRGGYDSLHSHDGELDAAHAHAHADVWLSDVSAGYGERTALEHVTVAVEPGSLLAVVGPVSYTHL